MNITVSTEQAQKGFYPTPEHIAEKMLCDIDWSKIEYVLEPSAGKGDLITAIINHKIKNSRRDPAINIDCIEIDPFLQSVLLDEFSERKYDLLRDRLREEHNKLYTHAIYSLSESEQAQKLQVDRQLNKMRDFRDAADVRLVHDDFLTYRSPTKYDLIVMNPPFADGDKHLLKALELQKHGGDIICLLNAETLRNPYSNHRKLLMKQLDEHSATIQFISDGFVDAERKTNVEIALVKIHIPVAHGESELYSRMERAVQEEEQTEVEQTALVYGNFIEQLLQLYKVEVSASLALIREYKALQPYITKELNSEHSWEKTPILTLKVERGRGYTLNENSYLEQVRLKYWNALFNNSEFTKSLTSDLQRKYQETVSKMKDYEFSKFNIKQVMIEMQGELLKTRKQVILDLFDELTAKHTWYPECEKNIHYFDGWASNKAHKIGKKSIVPTNRAFSTRYDGTKEFNVRDVTDIVNDIEKTLNYLSGDTSEYIVLLRAIESMGAKADCKNIKCKYFSLDFFKKGTMHIKYHNQEVIDRLNIYAAMNRNWLPPNYGKVKYEDMTEQEQQVTADFHEGDIEHYNMILARPDFYLADAANTSLIMI